MRRPLRGCPPSTKHTHGIHSGREKRKVGRRRRKRGRGGGGKRERRRGGRDRNECESNEQKSSILDLCPSHRAIFKLTEV